MLIQQKKKLENLEIMKNNYQNNKQIHICSLNKGLLFLCKFSC